MIPAVVGCPVVIPPPPVLAAVGTFVPTSNVPLLLGCAVVGGTNALGAAVGTSLATGVGANVGRLVYDSTSLRTTKLHVACRLMAMMKPMIE